VMHAFVTFPQAGKAGLENRLIIAAVNRCATQANRCATHGKGRGQMSNR
jgi:hypothetical protein